MMKKLMSLFILLGSSIAYASSPTITNDFSNPGQTAMEVSQQAYELAQQAYDKSQDVINALTNPNSCVYSPNFNCTQENLSYSFRNRSWTNPGNYSWVVPVGVSQVSVYLVSGRGGYGSFDSTRDTRDGPTLVPGRNGANGGASSFGAFTVGGGRGGDANSHIPGTINSNDRPVSVVSGQSISIIVGAGGGGSVRIRY